MLVAEFTPQDRKVFEKSKPATLMIADDFSGSDTALTALILLLYSQQWYNSRVSSASCVASVAPEGMVRTLTDGVQDRWWHCAEGCLSEEAGGG